jgi:type I restriction enzyme S subunit
VSDPNYGCPYYTVNELYELSPSTEMYLKEAVADRYRLKLRPGMILIQDSGQIYGLLGRPVMVGKHLDGATCTNNMVRLMCPEPTDTGFLFALLSTLHGTRLLKREASGSSIPHLAEGRIKRLRVPWPSKSIRTAIGKKVLSAIDLRDGAVADERDARALVERTIEEAGR